ncbi:hypothetical protein BC941DRAFT_514858 [Chlamydoabsidia padenii]|nr:hypothetical protein BC941DRAFT_514858 [Chlamydoabsidia padenii]
MNHTITHLPLELAHQQHLHLLPQLQHPYPLIGTPLIGSQLLNGNKERMAQFMALELVTTNKISSTLTFCKGITALLCVSSAVTNDIGHN